jgi:ABC-type molybdate transport system substrate-binding protein
LGQGARRPELKVWSCGGNYDLLLHFNRRFEQLATCRITYSSAPVEHLISVLASRPRGVDVLVGRSGPGWANLKEHGRLAGKPEVFALDPYVIIVPPGNPAGIRGLADLKRPDVKTAYSPTSSGPSGKVVRCILAAADEVIEPGIYEGYVRNAIEAHDCGWKVFPPVSQGRAHASVTRLSMTTAPETKGTVEVIPIPVEVMAAMRDGHGAIPQRAAVLADGHNPELAQRYVRALQEDTGLELCEKHGYIHKLSREAQHYKPLFRMRAGPTADRGSSAGGGAGPGTPATPPVSGSQRRQR